MREISRAVVLGARFGGLAVLSWLRRLYGPNDLVITVVDQWQEMIFRPGLVHAMDTSPGTLLKKNRVYLPSYCHHHRIAVVHDTIVGLDPERREVYTAVHRPLSYDVLFIATGSTPRWNTIEGLQDWHEGLCEGYLARHTAAQLARTPKPGRYVFAVGPIQGLDRCQPKIHVGCECPLIESALLWDARLSQAQVRSDSDITIVTPAPHLAETAGPRVRERVLEVLHKRHIRVMTSARYVKVEPKAIVLHNQEIGYDKAVWVPSTTGSGWLYNHQIASPEGWVPTDEYLRHSEWPNIYAIGDVVSHSWPKMGHSAMVQARIAVHHYDSRRHHRGRLPKPFRPSLLWALEVAPGHALFALTDVFYGGRRDWSFVGRSPFWAKEVFRRAYVMQSGALPVMP